MLVSLAATFSPLASNIYFPALDEIADTIEASNQAASLTVTTYMIAQGIAPSFWGPIADCMGRRQVLVYTLVLFIGANIGLALSRNIGVIMFFRFLQAAGSSSTISIGAGVIADIAPAKERGGFIGAFAGVRQFSMAMGPVLGGVLAGTLGFPSIFWTLVILGSLVVVLIIVLLPETLRAIAGNGSVPLTGLQYEPLYRKWAPWKKEGITETEHKPVREKMTPRIFFEPMLFLLEKDVACTLFFGAIIYTVFSMVSASTTFVLLHAYHLSTLKIGACFLPNGIGCAIGSMIAGRQMDKEFRLTEDSYKYEHNLAKEHRLPKSNMPADFPLERARLAQLPTMTAIFAFAVVVYGYSLTPAGSLAIPLMAQFAIGYSSTAVLNLNNTLTVDLYPGKSAAATAVNNLARCLLGAVGVSVTEIALERTTPGTLFLVLGCIVVAATPTAWAEWTMLLGGQE
ncbi:putative major facilitator superfamily transporter protein [Neofusicoccum parvum]|uniref:Major facilitator superfamily transporter protein n=1 Tax=Neofusicoccum parvum TaxID=310453 RepID=A0ACB5RT32_9PEZI|nr:putative major facilitator superfamily transporter protein [Neofusicoccum parvum]